ncbi:hypothetical protein GCM10010402_62630 [Actinomadura luteofluorescens]
MLRTVLISGSSTGFIAGPRWAPNLASLRRTRAADGGIVAGVGLDGTADPDASSPSGVAPGPGAGGASDLDEGWTGGADAGVRAAGSSGSGGRTSGGGGARRSSAAVFTASVDTTSPGTQPP